MNRIFWASAVALCTAAAWTAAPGAQAPQGAGKANWLMDGADNARTSWQQHETLITPASVKSMKLAWTVQTDNAPRQMHNLFPPLIVSDVQTPAGPREIAILAGVSDNIYGIDVEKGAQIWKRHFDSTYQEPTGCGRGWLRRLGRTDRSTPAAATATTCRSSRSTARRSSRRSRIPRPRPWS